jgi:uncharacterized repeat protein (TIGR03987 family)
MIIFSIIFIISAAILYSITIWTERIRKQLQPWMIKLFSVAFTCDLIGTFMMFLMATKKLSFAPHSICGYLALLIMGIHFFWAIKAKKKPEKYAHLFTKYSIIAWFVWMAAFVSGCPKVIF